VTTPRRATSHAAAEPPAPTFAAGTVRAMLDAFARLGHDASALLAGAGLHASDLQDPDGRISCVAMGAIYEQARQRLRLPDLDLRLAMETPLGAYPLLDYLVATSQTVGEGVHRLARHAQLTGAPVHVEIHDGEDPIRVVVNEPYSLFLAVRHLRSEAAGALRPDYVSLQRPPDEPSAVEAALGCPVRVGLAWNGFALSREAWALPLRRRDPVLQGVLERHAADIVARLPGGKDLVAELRRLLARRVARGDPRIAAVARELGTSSRSLQRRLASAGRTYQELLEQARCEAAERHLSDASLSIAEVSWLVGYSEPSAFHRAFKRWRGVSPRSFREDRRHAQPT
jgi:AraC-like DNA-binding protein